MPLLLINVYKVTLHKQTVHNMGIESIGEEESPLIYGLEFQSRSLCSHGSSLNSDSSAVRFVVGTQSIKCENQIHLLEYLEESNTLSKAVFRHPGGEVWNVSSSPKYPNLIATSYSCQSQTHQGKIENHNSIWKFPIDVANSLIDEDAITAAPLEKICDLDGDPNDSQSVGRTTIWHPEEGNRILSLVDDNKLLLWDVESHKCISETCISTDFAGGSKQLNRVNKINSFRWSPHSNCGLVGIAAGNFIYSRDLRVKSSASNSIAWSIMNAHGQLVRDLDFNPNAQYYVATCGDDCESRFWDVRNTSSPVLTMLNHSHWVWSIRYNLFHDQLVLTSSSDSRVILMRIASIASQPFGHLLDGDIDEDKDGDDYDGEEDTTSTKNVPSDSVIATYEEHEDSVYAAEWSSTDPWIFASLSYDGRLVINKVPKAEKFSILF